MGGQQVPLLPGYAVRILDGNALAATQHRLKVLRDVAAAPLPGKSLVVLDPEARLAVDIFPCEDGHAQERRLFNAVLETIEAQQFTFVLPLRVRRKYFIQAFRLKHSLHRPASLH